MNCGIQNNMMLILLSLVVVLAYFTFIKPLKYWTKRGVRQGSPLPIVGDDWKLVSGRQSITDYTQSIYNMSPKARYSGIYQFLVPTLVLRDPDLIKQVTVKDFDHFVDRRSFIAAEGDPLLGKSLLALKGQHWRDMRATLSPAFTSSKLKHMFVLLAETAEQFTSYFLNKKYDIIVIDMKDSFTRFANDVIASAAFGITCDSFQDEDNEFYLMGKEATDFRSFWRNVKMFSFLMLPRLLAIFKVKFFSDRITNFFFNLVAENVANRKKLGIVRPDLINLLMEARQHRLNYDDSKQDQDGFATVQESDIARAFGRKMEITDKDMAAQLLFSFSLALKLFLL